MTGKNSLGICLEISFARMVSPLHFATHEIEDPRRTPPKGNSFNQRKQRGGNSGEGKTYHKAPPQKRFMIRFPPPFVHAMSFSLEGKRAQTRQIPLSETSKTGFGWGHFIARTFPPQNRTIRFVPSFANSHLGLLGWVVFGVNFFPLR